MASYEIEHIAAQVDFQEYYNGYQELDSAWVLPRSGDQDDDLIL